MLNWFFFQYKIIAKPVNAPPTWAKCAIGPIEKEFETPKNKSPAIKIGTKYFALIGIGINNKKRQYELTPAPVNDDWKVPSLGGAKFLEDHLMNEVIPFLEEKYHAEKLRIGLGHSLGGTFVLNSFVIEIFWNYSYEN